MKAIRGFKYFLTQYVGCTVSLILMAFTSQLLANADRSFQIIIASDMPLIDDPINGDYRELQTFLRKHKAIDKPSFFIFGGGSLGPSPMSSFDQGAHIIDLLNWLEPDVMTLSKREFIYEEDELSLRAEEALFPFVSTNLIDTNTGQNLQGIHRSVILDKGRVKLGITSALDKEIEEEYLLKHVKLLGPFDAIVEESKILRRNGADFIVFLYVENNPAISRLLDEGIVDIAILVGRNQEIHADIKNDARHFLISELGEVLELNITLNRKQNVIRSKVYRLNDFGRAPEMTKYTLEYKSRLDRLLDIKIGIFNNYVSTKRDEVRSRENSFGNLIADAMLAFAGTDIAFVNSGVIRGNRTYRANTNITRRTIGVELPFRSKVNAIEISGRELKQVMENSVSQLPELKGRFLHISGFKVNYDLARPVGNRVTEMNFKGSRITPNMKFTAVTTDYLKKGGDGFKTLVNAKAIATDQMAAPLLSDIVIAYIRQKNNVKTKIDGRLSGSD